MTDLHTCIQQFFWLNAQNSLSKIQDLVNQGASSHVENDLGETPFDLLIDHFNKLMSELDKDDVDRTEIQYKITYLNKVKTILDRS